MISQKYFPSLILDKILLRFYDMTSQNINPVLDMDSALLSSKFYLTNQLEVGVVHLRSTVVLMAVV